MENKLESINVLGVRVDKVTIDQAAKTVIKWIGEKGKHFITTTNVEFIMAAQKDVEFKNILNKSDLAIPDSARFSWVNTELQQKSCLKRVLLIPFAVFQKTKNNFPVTTGVDLMDRLCLEGSKKGFTVGLLGGKNGVAKKAAECLQKKYPKLKILIAEDGPDINQKGEVIQDLRFKNREQQLLNFPKVDILFVAFGQIKQEKWIAHNLAKLPVKVMMGVGGAFDYLSGQVPRAPTFIRNLGLEWLFRLLIQPWRTKRQLQLFKFIYLIIF